MSAHTPGPWKFTEGEYFYVNARVYGKRVFILQRKKSVVAAATAYQEAEEDRIRADCHLIAAAPDLLDALKLAIRQNSCDMLMTGEELRKCEAAIARATGEAA